MNSMVSRASTMARELGTQMQIFLPADAGYAEARKIWNGVVDSKPAMFAMCESVEDVQAAVRAARAHDLPLSVRGGGHDWAGRSQRHDGLVIDLTRMRGVEVDASGRIATVGGGARATDLTTAASRHGLAAVTGVLGQVGITGLTLGGGYGVMSTRYGLAVDNLLGADVVLADGSLVTADETQNTDLYWALRGGGGNFGVVVVMRVRLHPVQTVLSGPLIFPWDEAEAVLRGLDQMLAVAPDDLGLNGGIVSGPQGNTVLMLTPTWFGDPAAGEAEIAKVRRLGHPLADNVGLIPYADLNKVADSQVVNGRRYTIRTRSLTTLDAGAISALVDAGNTRPTPFSVVTWQYFHGMASRIPPAETAFGLRRDHYMFQIIPGWDPQSDDATSIGWAQRVSSALASYAVPGGYPNLLVADDRDQVAGAYGDNAPRIRDLKDKFDPSGVFSSAIPLPE